MTDELPYEVRLPLAPYHFVWADAEPVDSAKSSTDTYTEERYFHSDGTQVVIRSYGDGSFHILSDRGPIQVDDNAQDWSSPQAISLVTLP